MILPKTVPGTGRTDHIHHLLILNLTTYVSVLTLTLTHLEEFGRLHCVIDSNTPSKSHWERNLRQYAHRAEPLFYVFTSIEALRWVLLVRNIDARGWELH